MLIRIAQKNDLDAITKINNQESGWFGAKDKSFFEKYLGIPFFYVIEENKQVCGFLMAMDESCKYDSKNFLWFKSRYEKFYYIDRVIIDQNMRKHGFGTELYAKLLKSRGSIPLVAEVSIQPSNGASVKFHEKLGFKSVGTFSSDGKTCRMYFLE